MPLSKEQINWLEQKRTQLGDGFVLDKLIEAKPERAETMGKFRAKYGDADTLNKYLNTHKEWRVSGSAWDALSPSSQKQYQQNYNIVVTGRKSTQPKPYETGAITGKPEIPMTKQERAILEEEKQPVGRTRPRPLESPLVQSGIKAYKAYDERVRQPIKEAVRFPSIAIREATGKIPTVMQIDGLLNNDEELLKKGKMDIPLRSEQANILAIEQMANEGLLPTKSTIITVYGNKRGNELIAKMEAINPTWFSDKAHWYSLGGIRESGKPADSVAQAIVEETANFFLEELTDPNEWVFDFALGAVGSKAVGGLEPSLEPFKNMVAGEAKKIRKKAQSVINRKYKGEQASQLAKTINEIPDDELVYTVAKKAQPDLDEMIYDAQKRDVLQQDITRAREEASTGHLGEATYREPYDQMQKRLQREEIARQAEQPEAINREYYKFPDESAEPVKKVKKTKKGATGVEKDVIAETPIEQVKPDGETLIAGDSVKYLSPDGEERYGTFVEKVLDDNVKVRFDDGKEYIISEHYVKNIKKADITEPPIGQAIPEMQVKTPTEAPSLSVEPTKAEMFYDVEGNEISLLDTPSKKVMDYEDAQTGLVQVGDIVKYDEGEYYLKVADAGEIYDEDMYIRLYDKPTESLPTEVEAELPTNIPESQTIAPEGEIATPETPTGVAAEATPKQADYPDLAKAMPDVATPAPDVSEVTQAITKEQLKDYYKMKDYTLAGYDAVNGEGSAQRAINDGLLTFDGDKLKLTESAKDDIFGVVPSEFKVKMRNGEPHIDTFFESAEVPPYAKRVKQSIQDGRPIVHAEIPYTNWKEFTETYPLYKSFDDMKAKAVVDVAEVEQAMPEAPKTRNIGTEEIHTAINDSPLTIKQLLGGRKTAKVGQLIDTIDNKKYSISIRPDPSTAGAYSVVVGDGTASISDRMMYKADDRLGDVLGHYEWYKNSDANGRYRVETSATPPTVKPKVVLSEYEEELKRLQSKKYKTNPQEKRIEWLKKQIATDPSKFKIGEGVGWRVSENQINRGFRIIDVNPEKKQVTIRSVADTGITTSGGNLDKLSDEVVPMADIIKDTKYDAPAKAYVPDDSAMTKEPRAKATAEAKAKRQAKKNVPAGQSISTQGLLNRIKPQEAKGLDETIPTSPNSRVDMSVIRKASERARKAKDFITNKYKLKEMVTATNYAELRSPKTRVKYGADMNKFGDELNIFDNVALRRSAERAGDEIVLTYGDLNDDQLASFWHVMQDKTHIGNYEKFGTAPKDINITEVINQLNTETQLLSQTPEGRQVLDAVARYEALMEEIKTDLIMRGKLNPDNVSDAFYFHRVDFNHVQDNVFKQKSAHDPMRGYAFKAFGGEEDIIVDQAVLNQYLTQVHYDNAIDDFVKEWLEKADRGNLLAQLTDEKLAQFKNDYLPYQYKRGNVVYSDEIVSFKALDEEINAFLDNYPDFTPQDVQRFLESITTTDPDKTMAKMAHIIGQRQKEYWIPKPMAEALSNMTSQTTKFMRQMERMTRGWKSLTLAYSSVSGGYQPQNLFGDWLNVAVRDNPESLKYAPVASKIWRWTEEMMGRQPSVSPRAIRKASEGLPVTLTLDEQEMMEDVLRYNVLGGTGITDISEYGLSDLKRGTKQLKDWWVKLNYMREAQPRIAMFAYQRDMVKKTGWVDTITFRNDVIGMEPMQAAAYISRNSPVDYVDVPSWYRHNMNGFWLPFVTYHHKNAVNWIKYTKNSIASLFNGKIPQEVLDANPNILQTAKTARGVPNAIKAISVPLIAYGSAYYWNTRTNEARNYAYKHLPETIQKRPNAIVLKTFNDMGDMGNPDGQPNRAWVIAPNMPDQLAMEFLGIDKFFTYAKSVDLKVMTPKEAAEAYLKDLQNLDIGVLKMGKRMINPLAKCLVSLAQNKDLVTGQAIYPDEVKDIPYIRRDYEAGYVMRTLLSAVSAYAYEQYEGEQLRASELVTGIPRSMGNTAKTLLGIVTPEFDEEAVERTGGWERWFAENKSLMGALGIYEVDLLKEKTKRIEKQADKVQRERNRVAYEITDLYVDAIVNKDISKLQEYITNGVASGELAPATLTINGVPFTLESPEMYWAELNKDIEQKLNNSTTIRKLINGLQRQAKTTGDMDKKLKLQNAYTMYRYDKVLKRLNNMATDEQVRTMDVIMDEFNFESEF